MSCKEGERHFCMCICECTNEATTPEGFCKWCSGLIHRGPGD